MAKFFFKPSYIEKKKKIKIIERKWNNYQMNSFLIFYLILGNFIKKGKKNISFFFLDNILFFLKKKTTKTPYFELKARLNIISPTILLFNNRRGTVIYELPRVLSVEQSLRKSIEWLVRLMKKRKKNTLKNIKTELNNITIYSGEIMTKKQQIILTAKKNKPFYYILRKKKLKIASKINVWKTAL